MAASLHVDARNYAKFLIAVVQGKGLAEATAKEMLRSQGQDPGRTGLRRGAWASRIEETPLGTNYGHGGRNTGFTSRSVMYKDQGIGYVFLVNNDDASKIDNILNAYLIAGKSGLKATQRHRPQAAKVDPNRGSRMTTGETDRRRAEGPSSQIGVPGAGQCRGSFGRTRIQVLALARV